MTEFNKNHWKKLAGIPTIKESIYDDIHTKEQIQRASEALRELRHACVALGADWEFTNENESDYIDMIVDSLELSHSEKELITQLLISFFHHGARDI